MFHATASSTLRTLLSHYGPDALRILRLTSQPDTFIISLTLAEYCEDYDLNLLETVHALEELRHTARRSA